MRLSSGDHPVHRFRLEWVISIALIFAIFGSSTASARVLLDAVTAKQALQKRGIGKPVTITESDGAYVTGILTALHDDSFEVTPRKATTPTTIAYAQVTEIHNGKSKNGPYTSRNRGQGVEIVAGVIVVGAFIAVVVIWATHASGAF
jgi:hypothetical protein